MTTEPWRPFPIDMLPEPLEAFIAKSATAMQCDTSFVALPVLSTLAAAVGATRLIELHRGWHEPCIVWCAVVGESGTLKTPAMRKAVGPLKEIQSAALAEHADRLSLYEQEKAEYERDYAKWKRGNSIDDPPVQPEPPAPARVMVSDVTVEGLAPVLRDNWRGVILTRDELAGWLGSFDRYSSARGGDVAHWLSMHTGESIIVDRKTSGTIFVPRANVCIIGGIQPATLRRALGSQHFDNGLAARLLLAMPPRQSRRWSKAGLPPEHEAHYALLIERLRELQPAGAEGEPEPVALRLDTDAERLWGNFYGEHNAEQMQLTGALASAWSKLEGGCARLALIVHLARWAADDGVSETHIDGKSMAAGIALAEWFKAETRRVYAVLGESDTDTAQRELIELVERLGGSITPNDLRRRSRRFESSDDAELALQELVEAGFGTWEQSEPGIPGRPARRFAVNGVSLVSVSETPKNFEKNNVSGYVDNVDAGEWGIAE